MKRLKTEPGSFGWKSIGAPRINKCSTGAMLAASLMSACMIGGCDDGTKTNSPNIVPDSGTDSGNGSDSGIGLTGAQAVRALIDRQVPGGIDKMKVPATDAEIPVAPAPADYPNRFDLTEAKRYLGKLLFHDPIRTQRVNPAGPHPLDFPKNTAFGGTILVNNGTRPGEATAAKVQEVVDDTLATGSCGSCHIGEAAGKAGQLLNFNTGGEGRGYTDEQGVFFPRRRPMASLIKVREKALFEGDTLVDSLPTLTDIFQFGNDPRVVATPALFYHNLGDTTLKILETGRLDQLDSVGRLSPSMIGFAFNNRLLFGGFGGEPHETIGSLQPTSILLDPPFDDPAQENLNFLLLDAHRMLGLQAGALLKIRPFVQAFREAFPQEAAEADAQKNLEILINDFTEARAQATFLRSVVTRDTPYDKFLAGDDSALTESQLRGAHLFFTDASAGGAACFQCHSGPMLNKQPNDPDLAGIGELVEDNFANVGIGDHPVQALNALARGNGTAYHAEDTGRAEITEKDSDRFKFRSMTLRQLKDARQFFHNGSLESIRDVVAYFNAGVPQDRTAGAEPTLDPRFANPRGAGTTGLGLSEAQIDDLTDFLENGLFDPTFKDEFNINADDLNYSTKHPSLAKEGAKDGVLLSAAAMDSNDPLARRDQGLEFLDVTRLVTTTVSTEGNTDTWLLKNQSTAPIDTHLLAVVQGLARGITVDAADQTTGTAIPGGTPSGEAAGRPYYRLFLPDGVLNPGQSKTLKVTRTGGGASRSYTWKLYSGQGTP